MTQETIVIDKTQKPSRQFNQNINTKDLDQEV